MDLEVAGSSPVAHPISKTNMTTIPIDWVGDKPEDADDWERIVAECAQKVSKAGWAVRLRSVGSSWLLEAARATGSGPAVAPSPDAIAIRGKSFDFRWQVTDALSKAGKPVIGIDNRQGGPPLSAEREAAIRSSVADALSALPSVPWTRFDGQALDDLLGEIGRLRGKLQLAGLARDLTGRAASTLRDACDEVVPRSAGRRRTPTDPNE